jgi:hypothetical protein
MASLADLLSLASGGGTLSDPAQSPLQSLLGGRAFDPFSLAPAPAMVSPGSGGGGGAAPAPGGDWEQVARRMAAQRYGWTGGDWRAIDSIIERESGWDPKAVNPSSGAYGIPQILPKAHPNAGLQNDPLGQIRWLLNYIRERYGTPQEALEFKNRTNWY